MRLSMGMTLCMLPRGAVAATDVAAGQAEPQMNPRAAGAHALFATLRRACRHRLKSFFMFADHIRPPQGINAETLMAARPDVSNCLANITHEISVRALS